MPSLTRSLDAGRRTPEVPEWAAPAVLLLVSAAALLLNAVGTFLAESLMTALVITLLSTIPLGALAYLAVRVYRHGKRLRRLLKVEEDEAGPTPLMTRAGRLYDRMLRARERVAASKLPGEGRFDAPPDAYGPAAAASPKDVDLITSMEEYVLQRYVACEVLSLDALHLHLRDHETERVEPLQRDHEMAFNVGIAGTVLGFGMQIAIGQSSLLSGAFLSGIVLKAGCMVVGIMVAGYARWLRWALIERYDQLIARLMAFASFNLSPLFADVSPDRADLARVLHGVVEELNVSVRRIETVLEASLAEAVEKASQALGDRLRETFATELAQSIKAQITEPFRVEVERLTGAVERAGDGIAEGVRGLNDGAREFKDEFAGVVKGSLSIGAQLQDTSHVLDSLTHKFEEIVAQAGQVALTLQEAEGEVALAVEKSRGRDGGGDGNWKLIAEMGKQIEGLSEERRAFERVLNDFAGRRSRNN